MDGNYKNTYMNVNFFVDDIEFNGVFDGEDNSFPKKVTSPHKHFQYEFHMITGGMWEFDGINDNIRQLLEKDSVILIPPGYYHSVNPVTPNSEIFGIRFEISRFKSKSSRKIYDRLVSETADNANTPIIIKNMAMKHFVSNIKKEVNEDDIGAYCAIQSYFTLIFNTFLRKVFADGDKNIQNPLIAGDSNALRKVKIDDFLGMCYANPRLSINALEKELNISLRQINRIFNKYYGCTFKRHLTDIRLSVATRMLLETELPIEEIAFRVGFGGVTSFYTAFKNKYNCTPNQYRNRS